MGQLEDEIEGASRGRKLPYMKPDDSEAKNRKKAAEEKFDKVNSERNAEQNPRFIPGKAEDMSP